MFRAVFLPIIRSVISRTTALVQLYAARCCQDQGGTLILTAVGHRAAWNCTKAVVRLITLLTMGRKTARNMQSCCAINKNWKFTVHVLVSFINKTDCCFKQYCTLSGLVLWAVYCNSPPYSEILYFYLSIAITGCLWLLLYFRIFGFSFLYVLCITEVW